MKLAFLIVLRLINFSGLLPWIVYNICDTASLATSYSTSIVDSIGFPILGFYFDVVELKSK